MNDKKELCIAIECEELPARFVDIAASELHKRVLQYLKNIDTSDAKIYATPRRVGLSIQVAEQTPLEEKIVTGPPVAAAYKNGEPTKAAVGFAKSRGKEVEDIFTVDSKKGSVIALRIQSGGEKTVDVISQNISEIILGMDFPQNMSWGDGLFSWARPFHNVIALFDGQLIEATVGPVQTSQTSTGHRLFATPFSVSSALEWKEKLREHRVIVDKEERKNLIRSQLRDLAAERDATVLAWDLIDEVVDLVEWPVTIQGSFDEELLDLPPRLLIEAMKIHQRVFPLQQNKNGKLSHQFLVVTNHPYAIEPETAANIAEGNRRVLTARFYDAKFFYAEDRKKSLEAHGTKLEGMRWIRDGGTMADKANRLETMVERFVGIFGADPQKTIRAAKLCKCDLATKMVYEFPELQGHVGHLLAKLQGEDETTALAIEEHYLPTYSGGDLPTTKEGLVLGFTDRWDTLSGCFRLGLQPKGSGDPLGLRRAANGLVQIMIEANISLCISDLCKTLEHDDISSQLRVFILARIRAQLQESFATDIVNAVMSTEDTSPLALHARCQALSNLAQSDDYIRLKTTFKRVMGLGKKHNSSDFSTEKFSIQAEHDLFDAFERVRLQIADHQNNQSYEEALQLLHEFAPDIDQYFESVMVMAEDESIRHNRLGFLRSIADSFTDIADFTQLQTENESTHI